MNKHWILAVCLVVLALCVGAWVFNRSPQRIQHSTTVPAAQRNTDTLESSESRSSSTDNSKRKSAKNETLEAKPDNRARLKAAKDYAEYARVARADAVSGDGETQFYLSEVLRYCQQNLSRYFLVAGKRPRTLDEAQVRWTTKAPAYQQEMRQAEIVEVYSRCHAFLEDPTTASQMEEWKSWLDKAVDGGYPPAQVIKATMLRGDTQVAEFSRDPNAHVDPSAMDRSHDLALSAVQSGDPAVLWEMSGLVDERQLPEGKWGIVPGAWQLLACAQGYDCSSQAEWLRNACSVNPVCIPGQTGQEYLKTILGSNFDQAQAVANAIKERISAKDWSNLPRYLWNIDLAQ